MGFCCVDSDGLNLRFRTDHVVMFNLLSPDNCSCIFHLDYVVFGIGIVMVLLFAIGRSLKLPKRMGIYIECWLDYCFRLLGGLAQINS